jgi:hypothetical protein
VNEYYMLLFVEFFKIEGKKFLPKCLGIINILWPARSHQNQSLPKCLGIINILWTARSHQNQSLPM